MRRLLFITIFLVTALLFVACSGPETAVSPPEPAAQETGSDDATAADETMSEHDDEAMADEEMADEATDQMAGDEAMSDAAAGTAWQQLTLTDAATGETFTFADFAGQTVFVEPMATWCTNCRRQLGNVREAKAQLGDDVVFVAISVENTISDADLAEYAVNQGFDWTFAVATTELLQALVDEFGRSITNPPATPHFIIRPDGTTTELVTGIEPAADLVAQIQAAAQ